MRNFFNLLRIVFLLLMGLIFYRETYAFSGSGLGSEEVPFLVTSCTELQEMSQDLDAHYRLENNIECGSEADINNNTNNWNEGAGFIPVGDENDPFEGSLNGNGKSISGLFINKGEGEDYTGLFGYTDGATITDLTLSNINLTGWAEMGGAVGYAGNGTSLENISVSGTINGSSALGGVVGELRSEGSSISNSDANVTITGTAWIGGLVGYTDVPITNSYATGNVTATGDFSAGGLVGETYNDITDSYATGNVSAPNYGGGLAGYVNGDVARSYSTGNVEVGGIYAGGLVGVHENGVLANSYARGNVQGNRVGGLVGFANNISIQKSYSTGAVTGTFFVGGLVGLNSNSKFIRSYWDTQTSGQSSSAGGEGKTTAELKTLATFLNLETQTVTFDSYSYTTANDSPNVRDPISWTLLGSNNGSDWIQIDSKEEQNITDDRKAETSIYNLSEDVTYSYVKWEITKRKGTGDCCVQVADLNLYLDGSPVAWSDFVFVTNPNGEGPSDEGPNNLTDGNSSTKWLDNQFSADEDQDGFTELIFDMNGTVWDIEASGNELNDGYPYLSWQVGGNSPIWYISSSDSHLSGSSESSVQAPACNDSAPLSVPDLFQIDAAGTYANLYFTNLNDVTSYIISYGLTPDANEHGEVFDYFEPDWVIGRTVSHLLPNTTYYFKVRAKNGCNAGEWSHIFKATTKGRLANITQWFANLVQAKPTPSTNSTSSSSPSSCIYTVKQGDSLWKIARTQLGSGLKYSQILALNPPLTENSILSIGKNLKLCN